MRALAFFRLFVWPLVLCRAAWAEPAPAAAPFDVAGRVIDALTERPVAEARLVADGQAPVRSDASGRFVLSLGVGHHVLQVTAPGYFDSSEVLEVGRARSAVVVRLHARARIEERVEVQARTTRVPGPPRLDVRPTEVAAVAGAGENVFRVLHTLPGVFATDDFGSRLAVRGGGPDQNLTVMDGIEVHNPFRLYGLTSAFNPETVRSFELSSGAFGVRYGDRLSSLLVVETRSGDESRSLGGSAAAGLTDSNLVAQGRMPGGSWLASARRTYYDVVAERFTDDDLPSFADVQGKLSWRLGTGRSLEVFGLRSRERAQVSFDSDGDLLDLGSRSRNDLAALTLRSSLGQRGFSRTVLAWTQNTEQLGFDASLRDEGRRSNAPGDDAFGELAVLFDREVRVRDQAVRQELTLQAGRRQTLDLGFEVHRLRTATEQTIRGDRNPYAANGSSVQGGAGLPDELRSARGATRLGAWLADRLFLGNRLVLEPGVRLDHLTINDETVLSPRLALTLALDAGTRLRLGGGLFTQSPGYEKLATADYFLDLSAELARGLRSERAWHAVAGIERELGAGVQLKLEGYAKRYERLLLGRLESEAQRAARLARYDFPAAYADSLPSGPLVTALPGNDGRGTAYGLELLLTRRAATPQTRLSGWLAYSFGRARRVSYARTYPFDYERPHAFSGVAAWRLSSRWELAGTLRLASGFPRTPPRGLRVAAVADSQDRDADGRRDELVPQLDARGLPVYMIDLGGVENLNSGRLPTYARLDLRASFTPRGPGGRWRVYVDVINALARKNPSSLSPELLYDPGSDRPRLIEKRDTSLPFLPSLGVHFRF